ncbi:MAG: UvrD-helicase domain-containing protein [Patescibacteria group bacterium]
MDNFWNQDLNPEQQAAVTHGKGPVLILAGAGSGKTRALTYRTAYLIKEKGVSPDKILLVTFTNKAAKEMQTRIKQLVGGGQMPLSGTFHSLGAKLLRADGETIGVSQKFLIYDEADSLDTIKKAITQLNFDPKLVKPAAVKAVISQAKNELIGWQEYRQFCRGEWQEKTAIIFQEYQRLLKLYQALDFDDLLTESVRLLKNNPAILNQYREKWEYILVDEYQDTNRAQYELTKMLASKWRNLCAVGDFSQSIYSWRGADLRNLNNLKTDYPDLKTINLEQNYRSTENILDAANKVISKNTMHPILTLWTKAGKGEKVKILGVRDEKQEAEIITNIIKKGDEALSDFAILYRTNAQSRVVEEALIKAQIPYILVGGTRFYSRKEVKDCLAYLRFLANGKDAISYQRMANVGKKRLDKFLDWQNKHQEKIESMTTKEILNETLKATDYLALFDEKDEQDLMRIENIKELNSVAEEFNNLEEFLENVALVEASELANRRRKIKDAVTLMTLHASKGLEFKVVFMVGMEEGLFPHARSIMDRAELEEERRLCYVGMTRAKEKLYMSYADRRLYFGSFMSNGVSRFLGDIDENLLELIHVG